MVWLFNPLMTITSRCEVKQLSSNLPLLAVIISDPLLQVPLAVENALWRKIISAQGTADPPHTVAPPPTIVQ